MLKRRLNEVVRKKKYYKHEKKLSCVCHVDWKIKNLFFFHALYICEEENAINRCLADIKSKDGKRTRRTVKKEKKKHLREKWWE